MDRAVGAAWTERTCQDVGRVEFGEWIKSCAIFGAAHCRSAWIAEVKENDGV